MIYRKEMPFGHSTLSIETGKMAKQANGAVVVQYGETVILATATASKKPLEGLDFFPLSVEYREKAYAAGKIPGGFFKREGRPSENEILSARLIDRPIRPMFPDNFKNEVQVIVLVLSADKENDPDVLGVIGASAALSISDIPFDGPLAAVRIGRVNGEFIVNPTYFDLEESDMELIIAGNSDSIIMVEGESKEISEEEMVAALEFGHEQIKKLVALQKELVQECGREKMEVPAPEIDETLVKRIHELIDAKIADAVRITEKSERKEALTAAVDDAVAQLTEEFPEMEIEPVVKAEVSEKEKELVRKMALEDNLRLDGRNPQEIRPITCEVGVLPRTHGSALFTRGQTQALAVTTLGTKMDEQKMDELEGEFWKSYMLHYNFPPFCVGEVRPIRGTSRREIGHGNLAERALKNIIPNEALFPYTIRIVSDILESNGSSSMATVCAGSLSLMDAGVPIKDAVAGIAMGLIKENDKYIVLSDILGDEDHLGDMDFKVAGTTEGINAFQMDIKIKGISLEILREALEQARQGRLHILKIMNETLSSPRAELSAYAPRIFTMKVDTDVIGMIIGPGGKTIREIIDRTDTAIDINDEGIVTIASVDPEKGELARKMIEELVKKPEVGQIYNGKVKKITNFGAFIEILPGKEGLLHISQIDNQRINRVEDVLKVGDEVKVKLMKIDDQGKLDLSRKVLLDRPDKK
ncbi:polyribonucleotide nucleotidyltransferase [candidate division KSB1 bacterium 4484_87]|nr:MAG: polyribonucleotide nucleotidyltransferase [candidate division KSB1 bacterium 4484_87]